MADITERIVIPEVPRVLDGQEVYVYIPKAAIFDLNIEKGTGNVLVQTIDPDHSFKVMTDGRAKVKSAPVDNDDVVRKQELDTKLNKGPIPSEYLPPYVDDVLEYDSKSAFPATGETGKIYIDKSTNLIYRWSGSTYIMVGCGDLNLKNGTGTGSIQQRGITYNKLITDYEPNMVAYVSYIGAGVSSPTSEQLIALLNSDKTNPYVAQILGNYTFEQYCVGFLAGTGAIQSGVSNKTAIDSLIAGALAGYGLTSSSDLSNIVGKVGFAAAILGAMNKAFSPGAFAGGVGCEAGDEGYPGNSVCSFAYGSKVKTKGICSVGTGRDLENLGDTSAIFGCGNKEYKIEGSEGEKANERIYLDNLAAAGGTVTGTGDDRVAVTGINNGTNNFMAGNSHYIGDGADNNAVVGNQNIIGADNTNSFISGLINYIGLSNGCGIIGYFNKIVQSGTCGIIGMNNKIEHSSNTFLAGYHLLVSGGVSKTVVGLFNDDKANTHFEVGNGTSETDRKNAFEVLKDGRAKVQSRPVEGDDVVRKIELDTKLDSSEFSVLTQSQVDLLF